MGSKKYDGHVRITVSDGMVWDRPTRVTWEGLLREAPVTALVPDGIVSRRTMDDAARLRGYAEDALAGHPELRVSATRWTLTIERIQPSPGAA